MSYIINPKTNRTIRVGGNIWKKLVLHGVIKLDDEGRGRTEHVRTSAQENIKKAQKKYKKAEEAEEPAEEAPAPEDPEEVEEEAPAPDAPETPAEADKLEICPTGTPKEMAEADSQEEPAEESAEEAESPAPPPSPIKRAHKKPTPRKTYKRTRNNKTFDVTYSSKKEEIANLIAKRASRAVRKNINTLQSQYDEIADQPEEDQYKAMKTYEDNLTSLFLEAMIDENM